MNYDFEELFAKFTNWFGRMGCIIAIVISYTINHSVWWALVHGVLSWFYIAYVAVRNLGPVS